MDPRAVLKHLAETTSDPDVTDGLETLIAQMAREHQAFVIGASATALASPPISAGLNAGAVVILQLTGPGVHIMGRDHLMALRAAIDHALGGSTS